MCVRERERERERGGGGGGRSILQSYHGIDSSTAPPPATQLTDHGGSSCQSGPSVSVEVIHSYCPHEGQLEVGVSVDTPCRGEGLTVEYSKSLASPVAV